jgi:BMFP domain-containing protein YqiC
MASKDQPKEPRVAPDTPTDPQAEDVLRPFQEASNRFVQASWAAHESALKQQAQAWLDFQDEVRQIEQEVGRAVVAATRKHLDQLGQQGAESLEQLHAARAQAQLEYENEIQRVYADAQAKLTEVIRKAGGGGGGADAARQLTDRRQDAYKTYLSDLQRAWSTTGSLDPQTMNAIASHILCIVNTVGQPG